MAWKSECYEDFLICLIAQTNGHISDCTFRLTRARDNVHTSQQIKSLSRAI